MFIFKFVLIWMTDCRWFTGFVFDSCADVIGVVQDMGYCQVQDMISLLTALYGSHMLGPLFAITMRGKNKVQ